MAFRQLGRRGMSILSVVNLIFNVGFGRVPRMPRGIAFSPIWRETPSAFP